ncbi:twin-arginine translocation signal domain-containing protein [Eggerthella lenta]|uniref:twin-arginine translocation signal domain-containing protein n=1 Tax=Eggerthella lenta TaxID=84112 RepID=UPI003DA6174E
MAEQATHGFTRRSFIKGAAALTATGALVGCSPQTQNLEKAEPQKEVPRDANLLRRLPWQLRRRLLP